MAIICFAERARTKHAWMRSEEADLYAACLASQQTMGQITDRDIGVCIGAMSLQVDAHAAINMLGRRELGKPGHLGFSFLWSQAAVSVKCFFLQKLRFWHDGGRVEETTGDGYGG